jgi:hypothetical protein
MKIAFAGPGHINADRLEAATRLYGLQGFGGFFSTRLELPERIKGSINGMDSGFPYRRLGHGPQILHDDQLRYFKNCLEER